MPGSAITLVSKVARAGKTAWYRILSIEPNSQLWMLGCIEALNPGTGLMNLCQFYLRTSKGR